MGFYCRDSDLLEPDVSFRFNQSLAVSNVYYGIYYGIKEKRT